MYIYIFFFYFNIISFNCINLPPYTSYDILEQKLLNAITEGIDRFTIG